MAWHLHRWVISAANECHRTAFTKNLTSGEDGQQPVTLVLHRCTRCPRTRTVEMPGHWTLEALTGVHPADTGSQE